MSTPSSAVAKWFEYDSRRISPSVTMSSPASSCDRIATRVASSWASVSSSAGSRHNSRARTRGGNWWESRSRSISQSGCGRLPTIEVGSFGSGGGTLRKVRERSSGRHGHPCAEVIVVADNYIAELPFGRPKIDDDAFVAPTAVVVGAVTMGPRSSIWYGAVARADHETIEIGEGSNVQDGCTLHSDPGFPLVLGRNVTVGHRVVLHGARIEDEVLVGMGSVVMNGAHIGTGSIVAAGAVVTQGKQFPA